jgi:hypothetical protein
MREFSVGGDGLTLANQAVTLAGFLMPTATLTNVEVLRCWASQQGSATSAQQRIQVVNQASVYPTVVTATPQPLKSGDATVSVLSGVAGTLTAGKCGINASAEGAGGKTVKFGDNFNVLNGYLWVATPRETMVMPTNGTSSFGLFLPAAATSLSNWAVGINYGEV